MFIPPPDKPTNESSKRDSGRPDLAMMFLLVIFSLITIWFGYWAPTFKPRWAYLLVQAGVNAVWIGIGITLMIFGERLAGGILILVAIVGFGMVLMRPEKDGAG
jgi:hypothetical protein